MKAMNEERPHRNFKGVWICAALWTHPKCLVAEVDSLTSDARPCYASNEFLAGKMQISPARAHLELSFINPHVQIPSF